jgi:hypothetical protein
MLPFLDPDEYAALAGPYNAFTGQPISDPDADFWDDWLLEKKLIWLRPWDGGRSEVRELTPLGRRALELAGAKDEPPTEQPSLEQHMNRVVQAIGDGNAARILAITNQLDLSGEQKMEEIIRLDNRFAGKNSVEWGKLLGVSPAAVRGYAFWKQLQERKKADW